MPAQFTIPLIVVIPGQLIASSLWNNEWNNLAQNLIPAGIDSYSDTDTQMQIQTNPFPGGVLSHATSLGGEIERIRYQLAVAFGLTFWYQPPSNGTPRFGGVIIDNPTNAALVLAINGVQFADFLTTGIDTFLDYGGSIGRLFFRANVGTLSVMALDVDHTLNMLGNRIKLLGNAVSPGDAVPYAQAGVVGGSASNAGPIGMIAAESVSTPDIRAQAISPGLLGNILGKGLTGANGNIISALIDNATISFDNINRIQVNPGSIGLAQINSNVGIILATGHVTVAGPGTGNQTITLTGRGRISYVQFNLDVANSQTYTITLDGVSKGSGNVGSNTTTYLQANGNVNATLDIFGLDFVSSAVITLSGTNTKEIICSYVSP